MTSVLTAILLVTAQATPQDPADPWADEPTKPAPREEAVASTPAAPERPPRPEILTFVWIGAVAASIGLGACSWFARENPAGLVCGISAGSLSLGILASSLLWFGGLIGRSYREKERVETATLWGSVLGGVAGLVVGGLVAGFAGAPPGVQRGVVGVTASGLLLGTCFVAPFLIVIPIFI